MTTILVTGGKGVIGSSLLPALKRAGWASSVRDTALDISAPDFGDIRDAPTMYAATSAIDGVIHLAAVSRVGWGEDDPGKCWSVNVDGTRCVVNAALSSPSRPWLLFVSSREVYGNPTRNPVVEDDPIAPVNTYGRSKAEGERIVAKAREQGLRAACVRLPSVYGSANDIPDRVVPAFARRALQNQALRITGATQLCDFLHVSDAVDGILRIAQRLNEGERALPVIHLASGRGTSLSDLAQLAKRLARSTSDIIAEPARSFDVSGFVGDPARARQILDWSPQIPLEEGLAGLIEDFQEQRCRSYLSTVTLISTD